MPDRLQSVEGDIARLQATVVEIRAELLLTQAALSTVLAAVAAVGPDPGRLLGEAVATITGFAEAAAAGLTPRAMIRPQRLTEAGLRIADWAEDLAFRPPVSIAVLQG